MRFDKKLIYKIRHLPLLRNLAPFWIFANCVQMAFIKLFYARGLKVIINGTDEIIVSPEYHKISTEYEPLVWKRLIEEVAEGDVVADVGAFIGLYAIALAKRVGVKGMVYAFEPDEKNLLVLKKHIRLNKIFNIKVINAVVGDAPGRVDFRERSNQISCVNMPDSNDTGGRIKVVESKTLDEIFCESRVDIVKIDIEGYEGRTLLGAKKLLGRKNDYPRTIFIELHPWGWGYYGMTGGEILSLLTNAGYKIESIDSRPMEEVIKTYGEIVAYRQAITPCRRVR